MLSWAAWLVAAPAFCHDPITTNLTWTNEISRLVYRHCASCHQTGGTAMSLMSYSEARPWAKAIRDEIRTRRMPPFDPVKGVGDFRDDPSLTQSEIDLFVSWVEGGAPEGLASAGPTVLPAKPAVAAGCAGKPMRVRRAAVLAESLSLCGIYAEGPLEVMAVLPDDSVRRLIWIREFHPQWNRAYVFRDPEQLPKGTRIRVDSPSGAAVRLLTDRGREP